MARREENSSPLRGCAAEDFPDFFEDPDTTVTVLSARRTFWEKATALHARPIVRR
nr:MULTISPECIES: nucleotidyl transferase AbiEii/AbiGii toxin family protein [unclassified Mesorhizobium]